MSALKDARMKPLEDSTAQRANQNNKHVILLESKKPKDNGAPSQPSEKNDTLRKNGLLTASHPSDKSEHTHRDRSPASMPFEDQADSKRSSAVSNTSTLASNPASGHRRKIHIGPWHLGATIGTGGTSKVRLVRHVHTRQKAVAKIISKTDADRLRAVSMAHLKAADMNLPDGRIIPFGLEREIVIMKLLDHKNIVRLYDVWENRNEIYIIMEYVEGGELFYYIQEHIRKGLEETHVVYLFRQIIAALLYCHRIHIHHRDLKPENILLDQSTMEIKLVDFGMAALQAPGKYLTTACGSPHYAAPELLVSNVRYDGGKVDIWSCGVILYVMLTGTPPFNFPSNNHPAMVGDRHLHALFKRIRAGQYSMPDWISPEAQDLISKIFVVDPRKRIAIEDVWAHPFLRKYDQQFGVDPRIESGLGAGPRIENWQKLQPRDVDREILRGLRCLWHSVSEQTLVEKLTNVEGNYEKYFYSALLKHREEYLENYAGFMTQSASDHHHTTPADDPPPLPRSKSAYSIMNNEHLTSNRSLYEPPPSETSYDPFRASRDAMVKTAQSYMNVTVYRGDATKSKATLKPPGMSRDHDNVLQRGVAKPGSIQSSRAARTSITSRGSSAPRLSSNQRLSLQRLSHTRLSAHRLSGALSRSSLSSSVWASSPPTAPLKSSVVHKRGVQFNHLRKSLTMSTVTTGTGQASLAEHAKTADKFTAHIQAIEASQGPTTRQDVQIRLGSEVVALNRPVVIPQLRIRKARDPVREVDKEARKVSAELDKLCQEAFYRSSVGSSTRSSATERQVGPLLDTPPSSISQISTAKSGDQFRSISRPLPALPGPSETPKSFTARELIETRNRIAARYAETNGDNADHFRDVLTHLDTLLPPSMRAQGNKRASSAPQTISKHLDEINHLPVISEEGSKAPEADDPDTEVGYRAAMHEHRAVTEPMNFQLGNAHQKHDDIPTIRVVEPSSPMTIAPLRIRKQASFDSKPSSVSKPTRYYASKQSTSDTRQMKDGGGGAGFKIYVDPDEPTQVSTVPSSDTVTMPVSSSTAVEDAPVKSKKRGWFRKTTSDAKELSQQQAPSTPVSKDKLQSSNEKRIKPKSSPRTWEDLDDRLTRTPKPQRTQRHAPALPQPSFTSHQSDAPMSEFSEFPMRRELSDKENRNPAKTEDNFLKGLRRLFVRAKEKDNTGRIDKSLRLASPTTFSSSDLDIAPYELAPSSVYGRSIATAPDSGHVNWLAKFLHIKPASKVLCFQVGRGRVRQEMVRLLRDWKRFGVRDVAFDRVKNVVSWSIDKANHLKIKPVNILAELFVVLEHGRRAQLAIVRFSQTRGAASSFRKVVDTLEEVMGAKGMLIEDEARKAEMVQILLA